MNIREQITIIEADEAVLQLLKDANVQMICTQPHQPMACDAAGFAHAGRQWIVFHWYNEPAPEDNGWTAVGIDLTVHPDVRHEIFADLLTMQYNIGAARNGGFNQITELQLPSAVNVG